MKLLDLLTSPWAILPEQLLEMERIYAMHLRGDKIDIDAIEARLGRPLANEQQDYALRDGGVAVLPIEGVLAPKANLFMRISGGSSTQMLTQQVESMRADPRVRAAIVAMDTPGGSVLGTPALAEAVRALAAEKPTVAVSTGTMASAGYWIGSAANAVYIEGVTDQVGSIGVVATHSYNPKRDGSVSTDITAGKYKRIAAGDRPLSAEGQAYLQAQVDHIYSVFVDAVAQHRNASVDAVLQHMADGRVFIGQQAIDAGLVDGVSTVDAMVEQLATNPGAYAQRRKAIFALGAPASVSASAGAAQKDEPQPVKGPVMPQADNTLTRESFERDHAALHAQLRAEFMAAGAAAELARIQGVFAAGEGFKHHAQLITKLAFDGKSTAGDAALAMVAADRVTLKAAATEHANDAPAAAPAAAAPEDKPAQLSKEEQVAKAQAYAAEHKVDFVTAMKKLGFAS